MLTGVRAVQLRANGSNQTLARVPTPSWLGLPYDWALPVWAQVSFDGSAPRDVLVEHAPQFGGTPERGALGLRPVGFGERGVHEFDRGADFRGDRCEAIEFEVVEIGGGAREHLPAFVDREPAEIDPQRLDREPARTLLVWRVVAPHDAIGADHVDVRHIERRQQTGAELYNHLDGVDEHVAFGPYPVAGNQHFEGDQDARSRCRLCREPIELDDDNDPESWIHTQDANYFGDHTAQMG